MALALSPSVLRLPIAIVLLHIVNAAHAVPWPWTSPESEDLPLQSNVGVSVEVDVDGEGFSSGSGEEVVNSGPGPCDALPRKLAERFVFDVIRKKCVSTLEPDCPENMELRSIPG